MTDKPLIVRQFEGDDDNDHRVAVFLQGGRFSGDRAAVVSPAPPMLYVTPCNCSPAAIDRCGMPSHWHDVDEMHVIGDAPRHGAYYVKTGQSPTRSGMEAVLYLYAGHERPSAQAVADVQAKFRRRIAAIQGAQQSAQNGRKERR